MHKTNGNRGNFRLQVGSWQISLLFAVAMATTTADAVAATAKASDVHILTKPHFEALRAKSSAVNVVVDSSNTTVSLGIGIPVTMGDSVKLVCLLTDTANNRMMEITKRMPKKDDSDNTTALDKRTQFKVIADRSFAPDFANMRRDQASLRRYDVLYGTARMSNNVFYNFSALNIRSLQPEDVGDYACTVYSTLYRSPTADLSLIMINAVYSMSFLDQPTRTFEVTRTTVGTMQTFRIVVTRHVVQENLLVSFRLCPTADLRTISASSSYTKCNDMSEICNFRRVGTEQRQSVSAWSNYWSARLVQDTWNCTFNVTRELQNSSLVASVLDHVTGKRFWDNVTFLWLPDPEPTQIQEITTELQCEPPSHQTGGYQGQVVTFTCRVAPVTQLHAFFWTLFTNPNDGPSVVCWDSNDCLMPNTVAVQETAVDWELGEASMRLDVTIDSESTVKWQFRAGVSINGATFYSKPFTVLIERNPPPPQTQQPNEDPQPDDYSGELAPNQAQVDSPKPSNAGQLPKKTTPPPKNARPAANRVTTRKGTAVTAKPVELADKVSGQKNAKPKKAKPSKAPVKAKSAASCVHPSVLFSSIVLFLSSLFVNNLANAPHAYAY